MSAAVHSMSEQPTPLGSRRKPEVVGRFPAVDLVRAERAVAELLAALGQDLTSGQLLDTPRRVAASYAELLTPAPFTPTTFPALAAGVPGPDWHRHLINDEEFRCLAAGPL